MLSLSVRVGEVRRVGFVGRLLVNIVQLKSRNGANAALRFTQIEPYAGEFERRCTASQRGVWGSEPPDLGSAPTSKTRNPQIYTACRFALDRSYLKLRLNNPKQEREITLDLLETRSIGTTDRA